MKGQVKSYSAAVNAGVIRSADGETYRFSKNDWTGSKKPEEARSVHFKVSGNRALDVKSA